MQVRGTQKHDQMLCGPLASEWLSRAKIICNGSFQAVAPSLKSELCPFFYPLTAQPANFR